MRDTTVSHVSFSSDGPSQGTGSTEAGLRVGSVNPVTPTILEVSELAILD